jgi:autotransporter strand-loop-strand O-heptosyltransferase
MNIDQNRLSKFKIKDQYHIVNGKGLIISNNFENHFKIIGNNYDLFIFEIYKDGKLYDRKTNIKSEITIKYEKFNYNVKLFLNDTKIVDVSFNPEGKKLLLHLDSFCLGDTIAWMSYIKDYYNKMKCSNLSVTNFWNQLFISPHSNIRLYNHYDENIGEVYSAEYLGYKKYTKHQSNNLQKVLTDSMNIEYVEKRPLIKIPDNYYTKEKKSVCISEFASDISKMWLYPNGWQFIVDFLKDNDYDVVVISKEKTKLKNIIDKTGNIPIEERIIDLKNCNFFIGVSSGLSWLAWALNKHVVMISGFSLPITEFKDNNYRIINKNVCHGCWNDSKLIANKDNNFCPLHFNTDREHECSKNITPDIVISEIKKLI